MKKVREIASAVWSAVKTAVRTIDYCVHKFWEITMPKKIGIAIKETVRGIL